MQINPSTKGEKFMSALNFSKQAWITGCFCYLFWIHAALVKDVLPWHMRRQTLQSTKRNKSNEMSQYHFYSLVKDPDSNLRTETFPSCVRDQQKQVVLNRISTDTAMEFNNRFISRTGVSDHLRYHLCLFCFPGRNLSNHYFTGSSKGFVSSWKNSCRPKH